MVETWDILDENGNLTGKTMNKGDALVWQDGIYHPGADVWVINSSNEILIQKRSSQKSYEPNVWAMTGGSVSKGETPIDTLKREMFEELGIVLNVDSAVRIKYYRTGNVWLNVFVVRQDVDLSTVVLQEEEVSEVKYATFEEIDELYKNGEFIKNRWEFVRDEIRVFIDKKKGKII